VVPGEANVLMGGIRGSKTPLGITCIESGPIAFRLDVNRSRRSFGYGYSGAPINTRRNRLWQMCRKVVDDIKFGSACYGPSC
jgi:hypothetical protein